LPKRHLRYIKGRKKNGTRSAKNYSRGLRERQLGKKKKKKWQCQAHLKSRIHNTNCLRKNGRETEGARGKGQSHPDLARC